MNAKRQIALVLFMAVALSVFGPAPKSSASEYTKAERDAAELAITGTEDKLVTSDKESEIEKTDTKKTDKSEKSKKTKKAKKAKKNKKKYTKKQLMYLATIIYCEAGGQCYAGRLAVGAVVLNRVRSKAFPNTIRKVIYQPYQFGPVRQGKMARELRYYKKGLYKKPERRGSLKAAKDALNGKTTVRYKGKKVNLKKYHFFNNYISGAKIQISSHQFK